jgi:hypothetical protein
VCVSFVSMIQSPKVFLLPFCRRRSEQICSNNLGGSDPRSRRRWAAAKPRKVGSLPPKIRSSPRSTPMLRRRSSLSFPATSTCRHRKSGRKSIRKVTSGPLGVLETYVSAASKLLTRRLNIFEYMAVRSSRSRNLQRSGPGNLG